MTRLNKKQRNKWYQFLAIRDGEKCNICSRTPKLHGTKLIVEHKDNNAKNNHPSNMQLACRRCNYMKNPRKKERKPLDNECVGVGMSVEPENKTEIQINQEKKPLFRQYCEQRLRKQPQGVPKQDLINSSAYKIDVSVRTTERYLRPLTSSEGPYELFKQDDVTLVRKKKNRKK